MPPRPWFYDSPHPIAFQSLAIVSELEREAMAKQAALLKAAEEGDEDAIARLREKGLTYWERNGRRII